MWEKLVHFWLTLVLQKQARSWNIFSWYDEKIYLVHKQSEIGPEIAFYDFNKFQKLVL